MKKIFLALSIMLTAATVTFAHTSAGRRERKEERIERREIRKEYHKLRRAENRNEVSDLTRNQFAIDFPDAKNVRFVRTKEFDEVLFSSGKKNLRAYYDIDNELVGTTQKKAFADLPEHAQKEILKKYAGYNVDDVIKFDDNESNETDMIMYGTTFDDADNYFVELKNNNKAIILKVDLSGEVSFFKDMK
jgi:hypothetical protein